MNFFALRQDGFTLIEVIIAIVLLGIIAATVSLGVIQIASSYVVAQGAESTAAHARLALHRIEKDFSLISSVSSSSATSITYTTQHGATPETDTLSWTNDTLELNGDPLAPDVSSFSLSYLDSFSGSPQSTWSADTKIIQVSLTLTGPDNIPITFTTRAAPRNLQ